MSDPSEHQSGLRDIWKTCCLHPLDLQHDTTNKLQLVHSNRATRESKVRRSLRPDFEVVIKQCCHICYANNLNKCRKS